MISRPANAIGKGLLSSAFIALLFTERYVAGRGQDSLTTALLVGVLASVAAGLAAAFVTGRLLRPLNAVRAATRRIAAGHYQASVPVPEVPELAAPGMQ